MTTTTTTLPENIDIAAAGTVCIRDAPWIEVTFGNQPALDGRTGTVTFTAVTGQVIGVHTFTFQSGATIRFVYPGAQVDAAGNAVDWPGWLLNADGFWVPDPSDAFYRDGLTVLVEINPTATATVAYPPATAVCASPAAPPPAPPSQVTVPPQLPATR